MNLSNILITPIVAAIIGIAVWYFQSQINKIQKEKEKLQDERRKVYADILDPFIRTFAGIQNPQEAQKALRQITSYDYKKTAFEFTLLGSDDVVKSFNSLMVFFYNAQKIGKDNIQPREMIARWGKFLLELRKSLGNPKTALSEIDMLRSLIKDIDNI